MSLAIHVTTTGFEAIQQKLDQLKGRAQQTLLEGLARRIQEQTQERIYDEKTSPAGDAWAKNRAGTSILQQTGALAESIDYSVSGSQAIVGTGLIYSAIHQFGGVILPKNGKALVFRPPGANGPIFAKKVTMPARPYIGLSEANRSELIRTAELFIRRTLGL